MITFENIRLIIVFKSQTFLILSRIFYRLSQQNTSHIIWDSVLSILYNVSNIEIQVSLDKPIDTHLNFSLKQKTKGGKKERKLKDITFT